MFGNATEPQGAVSTASLVFQRGVTGVWFSFQTVFMNPYFWFMNTWFRRVRLVTAADLFEDRFGSRGLSRLYALFQVVVACVFLGFGNYVAYKIASSLVVKPEIEWTSAERSSVDDYRELKVLEKQAVAGTVALPEAAKAWLWRSLSGWRSWPRCAPPSPPNLKTCRLTRWRSWPSRGRWRPGLRP